MMRILGIVISAFGIMGILIEAQAGKIFLSSVLLSLFFLAIGTYIFIRNIRVKFPKVDSNGMKKLRIIEDIVLETTNDLDHLSNIQNVISKMKKSDDVLFELVTLQNKENYIKVTNSNNETIGVIPYTYPHRKYIANSIIDGATVLGKVFKISRKINGKYKLAISVAPYIVPINNEKWKVKSE